MLQKNALPVKLVFPDYENIILLKKNILFVRKISIILTHLKKSSIFVFLENPGFIDIIVLQNMKKLLWELLMIFLRNGEKKTITKYDYSFVYFQ